MKLEFSRQIFEKYSNIKFYENPSSGSRAVPCAQTDRHDEANSRFKQFCARAYKEVCCCEFQLSVLTPERGYVPVDVMKAHRGIRSVASLTATRSGGVSLTPWRFYVGGKNLVPTEHEAGCAPGPAQTIWTPRCRIAQPVTWSPYLLS
jgi:hypothetical protein